MALKPCIHDIFKIKQFAKKVVTLVCFNLQKGIKLRYLFQLKDTEVFRCHCCRENKGSKLSAQKHLGMNQRLTHNGFDSICNLHEIAIIQ